MPQPRPIKIGEDAHDFKGARVLWVVDARVLANRVLVEEVALGKGLIDNGHRLRARPALLGKSGTAYDRHSDRVQKVPVHTVPGRTALVVRSERGMTHCD